MEELERALPVGRGGGSGDHAGATNAAILEASSAIAGGATVIVLAMPESASPAYGIVELAEPLAAELARRGLTVVLLGAQPRTRQRAGANPVGSQRAWRRVVPDQRRSTQ